MEYPKNDLGERVQTPCQDTLSGLQQSLCMNRPPKQDQCRPTKDEVLPFQLKASLPGSHLLAQPHLLPACPVLESQLLSPITTCASYPHRPRYHSPISIMPLTSWVHSCCWTANLPEQAEILSTRKYPKRARGSRNHPKGCFYFVQILEEKNESSVLVTDA